ncbi:MAG TPA: SIMPL domain-containing protein [Candidatus Krumholzibacteria bacterium]|nr:SIMPL domain-containing protein [Candidatus Krumholzibacteria bacterium]
MTNANRTREAALLAVGLVAGLALLGWLTGSSLIRFKEYERTVTVKGLAEREVAADTAIWPVMFTAASNDLAQVYAGLDKDTDKLLDYLKAQGFADDEITVAPPAVTDKLAQQWGGGGDIGLRYTATRTVTVFTRRVDAVRTAKGGMAELGRQGLVIAGNDYQGRTEYLFSGLNDLKPAMVEEATRNAREVAQKFAADSQSRLGKIKKAQQGVFSIEDRDPNTPHIKKVRVVSTVEYYLAD